MFLRKVAFALWAWMVIAAVQAADLTRVEVFPLQHRTAAQMVPLIEPMVGAEGAVSGMYTQLIVRATPSRLQEIRAAIAKLDAPLRRLMIEVRQLNDEEARELELAATASATGRSGSVSVGPRSRFPDASQAAGSEVVVGARIASTQSHRDRAVSQQIQVLDGSPAFIQVGRSVPIRSQTILRDGYGIAVRDDVQYRDVTTGFQVIPHTRGDRVTLDIIPHQQQLNRDGTIGVQAARTTIETKLGEWTAIGGTAETSLDEGRGVVYSTRRQSAEGGRIYLRVSPVQ